MRKFCLQFGDSTREKLAIFSAAPKLGYEFTSSKLCPIDCIPIGSVEFCESILPPQEGPKDFYPDFLKEHFHRSIDWGTFGAVEGTNEDSAVKRKRLFLKKSHEWKSNFESRVVEWNEQIPYDFYYFSEPVEFVQEWRYYIAGGVQITTGWYKGDNEEEPAPDLGIDWPKTYNAAVDFGRLKDGRIALVESHAPFACGWYGDDHKDYALWQYESWNNYIEGIKNES
jgi:hypothetical protein